MLRPVCLCLLVQAALCGVARAHHFAIDLEASGAKEMRKADADTLAPGVKAKTRAILSVKAGERVKVRWTLTNSDAKTTFKNVLIHFFVVKQDRVGQQDVPKLNKGVVVESALTMDFLPGDKSRGELAFALDNPGTYLLRLETLNSVDGAEGHEHFAALDVVAQGKEQP